MNVLRFPRALRGPGAVLFAGLLLVLAIVAGGVHHHSGDNSHPCGICSLSQAPATAVAAVAEPAPSVHTERILVAPETSPRDTDHREPSSRGPPTV